MCLSDKSIVYQENRRGRRLCVNQARSRREEMQADYTSLTHRVRNVHLASLLVLSVLCFDAADL